MSTLCDAVLAKKVEKRFVFVCVDEKKGIYVEVFKDVAFDVLRYEIDDAWRIDMKPDCSGIEIYQARKLVLSRSLPVEILPGCNPPLSVTRTDDGVIRAVSREVNFTYHTSTGERQITHHVPVLPRDSSEQAVN